MTTRVNSKTHLKQAVMDIIGSQYRIDLMYLNCESLRELLRLLTDLEQDKVAAVWHAARYRPRPPDPPQAIEFLRAQRRKIGRR